MGGMVGPTPWWQSNLVSACPEGSTLPDGSILICKAGGTAWIVAPQCTVASFQQWGNYPTEGNTVQGDLPQITSTIWPGLYNTLVSRGFNPDDWFVPSNSEFQNILYVCKDKWLCASPCCFWTSTEGDASSACARRVDLNVVVGGCKSACFQATRAFRCVTY